MLILLAHCDDEFFIIPRIERELKQGSEVFVVFTTDGAAYKADAQGRLQESLSVLCACGVKRENVIPLGIQLGVADGASYRDINRLYAALAARFDSNYFDRIYALAWEGGHADHDVVHLLAAALRARSPRLSFYEFSAYQGSGLPGPFFRCMSLLPNKGDLLIDTVSTGEAFRWLLHIPAYRSQYRSFAGLGPFILFHILCTRRCICRLVGTYDYGIPPHTGRLYYEKSFKLPFAEFRAATEGFVSSRINAQYFRTGTL